MCCVEESSAIKNSHTDDCKANPVCYGHSHPAKLSDQTNALFTAATSTSASSAQEDVDGLDDVKDMILSLKKSTDDWAKKLASM